MVSGAAAISSSLYGQLQAQSVRRSAEQAESRANALQAAAANARRDADQANEKARTLAAESSQAQGEARDARRGVAVLDQAEQGSPLSQRLATLANASSSRLGEFAASSAAVATSSTASSVPTLGSLIDVTA